MANAVRKSKTRRKQAVPPRGPFALHFTGKDGSQTVCLGNLHVLLTKHEDTWLAQGLEIDYAIDGDSIPEVKARFEKGLTLTIESHLRVYSDIKSLLRVAPQPIWDKFYAAVPPDIQHEQGLMTVRALPKHHPQQVLPFDKIVYAQAA